MNLRRLAVAALAAFGLIGAASAEAKTVTLGSPLTGSGWLEFEVDEDGTGFQEALPGATLTAPFNGRITSWRMIAAPGGPVSLTVIRPLGGGLFTGAGKVSSGPITETGVRAFKANLPIEKGDAIGISATDGAVLALRPAAGAVFSNFVPSLADAGPGRAPATGPGAEFGVNATVESNCVVPKLKGKRLKQAKKKLKKANCRLGKVKKPKSKKARKKAKYVKKQRPGAGTELAPGSKVKLTMGPKKKKQ